MCGIFGCWQLDRSRLDLAEIEQATTRLRHRGPDDEGYFLGNTAATRTVHCGGSDTPAKASTAHIAKFRDEPFDIAFGFRRLSIQDLSPAGHQPMPSHDGRYCIVFNGEVYNYRELRDELRGLGHHFRGGSDTEVILAAYQEWGPASLHRFNGMWGLAIWDTQQQELFLARDRFGVKPLHYTFDGTRFAFASEIKALVGLNGIAFKPSDRAIYDYLDIGYLPSPQSGDTFLEGVNALPPGRWMRVTRRGIQVQQYYTLPTEETGRPGKAADVVAEYRDLFEDAIRLRLRADVPVGTCLSGGLDSSSIVCVVNRMIGDEAGAAEQVGTRQQTFSAVYDVDAKYNERKHIDKVLDATGAAGNFVFPTGDRLQQDITKLAWHQDEPFGSTSIFAQWCVMSKVRERGVTVLLDGQGADEALAGYRPFDIYAADLLRRGKVGRMLSAGRDVRRIAGEPMGPMVARAVVRQLPERYLTRMRRARVAATATAMRPEFATTHEAAPRYMPVNRDMHLHLRELVTETSLPHLLRYEDRNSMAFSVEGRVPFLDYRLVEFSLRQAFRWCINDGWTKWVLREAMRGTVPEDIIWRRDKVGFETPEHGWQAEWLREHRDDLFGAESRSAPYLDLPAVRTHVANWVDRGNDERRDDNRRVWRWINLELWLRAFA